MRSVVFFTDVYPKYSVITELITDWLISYIGEIINSVEQAASFYFSFMFHSGNFLSGSFFAG